MSKPVLISNIIAIWSVIGAIFIVFIWAYSGVSFDTLFYILPWYKSAIIAIIAGPLFWAAGAIVYGMQFGYDILSNSCVLEYLTTK